MFSRVKLVFVRTSDSEANIDAGNYTGDIFSEDITVAANGVVTEGTKTNLTNMSLRTGGFTGAYNTSTVDFSQLPDSAFYQKASVARATQVRTYSSQ